MPVEEKADGWLLVGRLAGAHGVTGEVRLVSFTADAENIAALLPLHKGPGGDAVSFKITKHIKGAFAIRIDGIKDRDAAELTRGIDLYVPRERLPADLDEDEYYLADLIGLKVEDENGEVIGTLKTVDDCGSGDLLEIHLDAPMKPFGRVVMLPFTRELVPVVDMKGGRVVARITHWAETHVDGETA